MSNRALFSKLAKKQPLTSSESKVISSPTIEPQKSTTRQSPRARKPNPKFKDFDLTNGKENENLKRNTRKNSTDSNSSRKTRSSNEKLDTTQRKSSKESNNSEDGFYTPRNYGETEQKWKSRCAFAKLAKAKPSTEKSLKKNGNISGPSKTPNSDEVKKSATKRKNDDDQDNELKKLETVENIIENNKTETSPTETEEQTLSVR